MVDLFSDTLTIRDTPGGISNASTYRGTQRVARGLVTVDVEPVLNEVLYFVDIPSNDIISNIFQYNEDLGSDVIVTADVYAGEGFVTQDGTRFLKNELVRGGVFSTANTTLDSPNIVFPVDIRFENSGNTNIISSLNLALWELADLTVDPSINLRLGYKIDQAFVSFNAGDILLIVNSSAK